jgi:hypothetical protein
MAGGLYFQNCHYAFFEDSSRNMNYRAIPAQCVNLWGAIACGIDIACVRA